MIQIPEVEKETSCISKIVSDWLMLLLFRDPPSQWAKGLALDEIFQAVEIYHHKVKYWSMKYRLIAKLFLFSHGKSTACSKTVVKTVTFSFPHTHKRRHFYSSISLAKMPQINYCLTRISSLAVLTFPFQMEYVCWAVLLISWNVFQTWSVIILIWQFLSNMLNIYTSERIFKSIHISYIPNNIFQHLACLDNINSNILCQVK